MVPLPPSPPPPPPLHLSQMLIKSNTVVALSWNGPLDSHTTPITFIANRNEDDIENGTKATLRAWATTLMLDFENKIDGIGQNARAIELIYALIKLTRVLILHPTYVPL